MPFDPTGLINTGAGAILGIGLGDYNDNRQVRQQERLQKLQIEGQKEMMDYSSQKQLQMWHDTNYWAQVAELEKAGLNPGLLYGMSGGGGVTTGSPQGNVSGGSAQQNAGEVQQMMGIGLQLKMQEAQIKVMETQAEKNKAEATATSGVQTDVGKQNIEESKARIANLSQGLDNQRQEYEIKRLEITMKNIENFEKQASQQDRLKYITYEAKTAAEQYKSAAAEANIDQKTVSDKIKIIHQEAVGAVLKNVLIQSQTQNVNASTANIKAETGAIPFKINVMDQQAKSIYNTMLQGWDKLNQGERELRVKEALKDWNTDPNREAINQAVGAIDAISHTMKKGTTINNFYE